MQQEGPTAEPTKVTLEAVQILGQWHARLVVTRQDEEGDYAEPYVVSFEVRPLWMAGPGWQAAAVLQQVTKHLDAALRDGYE